MWEKLQRFLVRYWKYIAVFIILALTYIGQIVTSIPDETILEKYHLTLGQSHALGLTIGIPYIVIWAIALIGFMRLRSYQRSIQGGKDAEGFRYITWSVLLLALWLPLSTLLAGFSTGYYGNHPGAMANLTRLNTIVNIVLLLPAFYLFFRGADRLHSITRLKRKGLNHLQTLAFIAFSAGYVYVTLRDPNRQVPVDALTPATYYMPDWLIVVAVIIPRLIMWYWGCVALANLMLYRQRVKGTIYKAALQRLAYGLGAVVLINIGLRVLQTVSAALNDLSLGFLLLLIYVLLLLLAVGYVLIAKGSKRLQKIEEL